MSEQEALKRIMEARGYELRQRPDGYLYWRREESTPMNPIIINSEEALSSCKSLNVLAEIWFTKLRGFNNTHFHRDFVYAVLDDHDPTKALIIIAEALEALKEK